MKKKLFASAIMMTGLFFIVAMLYNGPEENIFVKSLDTIFLILAASSYISYRSGLNLGYVLLSITIPICACDTLSSLIISLQTIKESGIEAFWEMSVNLSVLIMGAILSSIGYFITPKEADFSKVIPLNYYDILVLLFGFCFWFIWSIIPEDLLDAFVDPPSLILVTGFLLMSVGASIFRGSQFSVALVDGSVAALLFGIVIASCFYFASLQDPRSIGPLLAVTLLSSIYGCICYYMSFFVTVKQQTLSKLSFTTKNWHIIEAMAFLIFMIYGPPTIWEAGGLNIAFPNQ